MSIDERMKARGWNVQALPQGDPVPVVLQTRIFDLEVDVFDRNFLGEAPRVGPGPLPPGRADPRVRGWLEQPEDYRDRICSAASRDGKEQL